MRRRARSGNLDTESPYTRHVGATMQVAATFVRFPYAPRIMRRGITKLLLFGLVAATGMLIVRLVKGPPKSEALVSFDELKVDRLVQSAFDVQDRPVRVQIAATGSLQSDSVLAAYPWIRRMGDREVVWALDPSRSEPGKGMTLSQRSVVTLDPGHYDAFFTSYGDPLRPSADPVSFFDRISSIIDDDFQRWRTEAGRWNFSITILSDEDRAHAVPAAINDGDSGENVLWATGPLGDNMISEYLFETASPVEVLLRCSGEIYRNFEDVGWIEDVESGDHIWDMTLADTSPSGGSIRNRSCVERITLAEGRYRAVFRTDGEHAFGDWKGNPPLDPNFWGMELSVDNENDAQLVAAFDPWESLPRIASLTGIGDDQLVSTTFTLDKPMRVMVQALGEGSPKRNQMFDYAWIVGAGDKEVWKMTMDQTKGAGGSSKNRRAETVLEMDAGVPYTLYYKTDGSHSAEGWNEDPPLHPDQWGVTLFALDPDFIPNLDTPVTPPVPPVTEPGYEVAGGEPIVMIQSVGNSSNEVRKFSLADSTSLHIYALGEMTRDGRYDWGWITNTGTGAAVWEMRRENSVSAGGTSKNRLVDVVIKLPPGDYEAHYVTDDSHAFPDFRYGGAPDNPTAWGMSIQRVERDEGKH